MAARIPYWTLSVALALTALMAGCSRKPEYYLERGHKLYNVGKFADAVLEYRKAAQRAPQLGEAYYRWGLAEWRSNRAPEAIRALGIAVGLMPEHEESRIRLADLLLTVFRLNPQRSALTRDQVVKLYDQVLQKNPKSFDALRIKGSLLLLERKSAEAVEVLRQASGLRPLEPSVTVSLIQALFWDKQARSAEQLARQLIAARENFGPAYDALYLGLRATNRDAEAEQVLVAKADHNPNLAGAWLDLAGHYYQAGNQAKVKSALNRLLKDPTIFPDGKIHVGNFYAARSQWAQALEYFKEGPAPPDKQAAVYRKRMVAALMALGRNGEALRVADELVAADARDLGARAIRASLWLNTREPEKLKAAIKEYGDLAAERPRDAQFHFDLGRAHLLAGDSATAVKELNQALSLRRWFPAARLLLAQTDLTQGDGNEAVRHSETVLARMPRDPTARLFRAAGWVKLGRLSEARPELNSLAAENPNAVDVKLEQGVLAVAEKKYGDAERILAESFRLQRDMRAASGLVEVYTAQGRLESAERFAREEVKKSPDSLDFRRMLAAVHIRQGRHDEAIGEYRDLLKSHPQSLDLHMRLGDAYRVKGDLKEAVNMSRAALRLAPDNASTEALLAEMLVLSGAPAEALQRLRNLLRAAPDNPMLLNNTAYLLAESGGNLKEAAEMAQRAWRQAPKNNDYADTLGWVFLKQKNAGGALRIFERVLKTAPDNPVYRYHFALAHLDKGDKTRARAELELALRGKPPKELEQQIQQALRGIS